MAALADKLDERNSRSLQRRQPRGGWVHTLVATASLAAMLLGGYLLAGGSLGESSVEANAHNTTLAANGVAPVLPSLPIEQIRLGQRVAGVNPIREQVEEGRLLDDEGNEIGTVEVELTTDVGNSELLEQP